MSFVEGQKIQVTHDLDFFPFFVLKAGTTGTVVHTNSERGSCYVKLDDLVEGCEYWDNEVPFNVRGAAVPDEAWYTIEDVCRPLR